MNRIQSDDFKIENQGTNTFLVYDLKKEEEIDTFIYGMISNNRISGIVPAIVTQIDKKKEIKFNISSKINLKQYFNGIVNKQRFITVLYGVASAVLAGEEYMLDADSFLLDPSFIYVNVGTGEPELVCFPVKGIHETTELIQFYKELVFSTQFDQGENVDYVAKIISFLNSSDNFSLPQFAKMLEELKKGNLPSRPPVMETAAPKAPPRREASFFTKEEPQNPPAYGNALPAREKPPVPELPQPPKPEAKAAVKEKPKKKFSLFGSQPKEKKKKEAKPKKKEPLSLTIPGMEKEETETIQAVRTASRKTETYRGIPVPSAPEKKPAAKEKKSNAGLQRTEPYASETTVLSYAASGETTVLSNETVEERQQPFLLRLKTNEKIMLNKEVVKIGKEMSFVDYCIQDNPAVSRIHANIICRAGKCYVMDMNSKNHTYVNSDMIVGNTERELNQGDILCLANEKFEFKTI